MTRLLEELNHGSTRTNSVSGGQKDGERNANFWVDLLDVELERLIVPNGVEDSPTLDDDEEDDEEDEEENGYRIITNNQ